MATSKQKTVENMTFEISIQKLPSFNIIQNVTESNELELISLSSLYYKISFIINKSPQYCFKS